jgi:hypothetical protein
MAKGQTREKRRACEPIITKLAASPGERFKCHGENALRHTLTEQVPNQIMFATVRCSLYWFVRVGRLTWEQLPFLSPSVV